MAFDGIVMAAMAGELADRLTGGRIDKIYQPEEDELLFHIQRGREKYRLFFSSSGNNPRLHLTNESYSNPLSPMPFCMLLRKHFQSGRIAEIRQVENERILEIYVDTINELGYSVNRKLVVEIMGKHSNIIAVDLSTGKILDSIKRVTPDMSRSRQVLPGLLYTLPPGQGKAPLSSVTEAALEEAFPDYGSAEALLSARVQGFSKGFAAELGSRAEALVRNAGDAAAFETVPAALFALLQDLSHKLITRELQPVVYLKEDGTPADFHAFPLEDLASRCRALTFGSVSEAAEYYFSHKAASNRMKQKSTDLLRTAEAILSKYQLKKQKLSEELLQAQDSDKYRLYGELLTASLHTVTPGAPSAQVLNYYDNTTISIPLDPRFSPSKNAQRYFKKYAKARTAIKEKTQQLLETDENIEYLESILAYVESAGTPEEIEELRQELVEGGYLRKRKDHFKPSKSKLQPYAYTTSDGFRLSAGRNNKENDHLTFKVADKKDIWFHTKDIPGSHVILFTEGRPVTETALFEAAAVAAWHSKGQSSENVPVDYVSVRHVKKPNGAKPGMVIFTDNRTLYVNPALPAGSADKDSNAK
ncbi:MAG: NFACT family protein [Firmicutes bacterium]|nr:NFACT family protein [Bacillota bacterium]